MYDETGGDSVLQYPGRRDSCANAPTTISLPCSHTVVRALARDNRRDAIIDDYILSTVTLKNSTRPRVCKNSGFSWPQNEFLTLRTATAQPESHAIVTQSAATRYPFVRPTAKLRPPFFFVTNKEPPTTESSRQRDADRPNVSVRGEDPVGTGVQNQRAGAHRI